MDPNQVIDTLREGVWVALRLGGPILILSMGSGIIIAIFQAATQIHEQTLSFVPKLLLVIAITMIGGSWMLATLQEFTRGMFTLIVG